MKVIFKSLLHPVTLINLLICGSLILIGIVHNHAHQEMEKDIHAYVRKFCKKSDKCVFSDY